MIWKLLITRFGSALRENTGVSRVEPRECPIHFAQKQLRMIIWNNEHRNEFISELFPLFYCQTKTHTVIDKSKHPALAMQLRLFRLYLFVSSQIFTESSSIQV